MLVGGLVIALVGLALLLSGRMGPGLALAILGLAVEVSGAWVHDRGHRRRGEQEHALWGAGNQNRPTRLRSRR